MLQFVYVVAVWSLMHLVAAQDAGIAGGRVPPTTDDGWYRGRATFYGASPAIVQAYEPVRGNGSFGIIPFGSCGYTNSNGNAVYPLDAAAALADANPDFPGSCGRCYQVRCRNGLVLAAQDKPVSIYDFFYLAGVNRTVKDTRGRSFPGNPLEAEGEQFVNCWNNTEPVTVTITDRCPCQQQLPGEVRRQQWCCGDQYHMDLSYYAFEKLAHPVYGTMMIDFRPVDCDTAKALPLVPGYISRQIYKDKVLPGWEWFPYSDSYAEFSVPGAGKGGSAATCMTLTKGGGFSLRCTECYRQGYEPFAGVQSVSFDVREFSGSPKQPTEGNARPPLKMFLMNHEKSQYCNKAINLQQQSPANSSGDGWLMYVISFADFACQSADAIDRVDWQNTSDNDVSVCFDNIALKS